MRERLKPCPFCLSDDIQTATDYYTYGAYKCEYIFACCPDCGARGPMALTEDEAISLWNDRPSDGFMVRNFTTAEDAEKAWNRRAEVNGNADAD